jgi:hypothetical protein
MGEKARNYRLVEFLSAYAGRGAYLRQEALRTVRAILDNAHVTVRPQTHESLMLYFPLNLSGWTT